MNDETRRRILRRPKPRSLRQVIVGAVAAPFIILAGFGIGFAVTSSFAPDTSPDADIAEPTSTSPAQRAMAHATERAAALVEVHDCWTGEAPAGVEVPGHVVVIDTATSGKPRAVYSARLVGPALDSIFGTTTQGADFTVVAFCP